jgi:transcriptional regulator with XRE-family HTH domain
MNEKGKFYCFYIYKRKITMDPGWRTALEPTMTTNSLAKRVGQAIARQRKLARLTQSQVAEKLGIEVETVSRLETATWPVSLARLEQLGELFGCPVVRFFRDDSEVDDNSGLQTLADILLTLNPDEKTLLVSFMTDAAMLFKNRK